MRGDDARDDRRLGRGTGARGEQGAVAEQQARFAHLWVRDRAEDREFQRRGRGDQKIRDVEARAHGFARQRELRESLGELDEARDQLEQSLEELRSLGVIVVLEGADATYPLRVDSLQRFSQHRREPQRPLWLLLSVTAATDDSTRASHGLDQRRIPRPVPEAVRGLPWPEHGGRPAAQSRTRRQHRSNPQRRARRSLAVSRITSKSRPPLVGALASADTGWLRARSAATSRYVAADSPNGPCHLPDRTVVWIEAEWDQLQALPIHAGTSRGDPPSRVHRHRGRPSARRARRAGTGSRRTGSPHPMRTRQRSATSTPVCHRTHILLEGALAPSDVHSIVGDGGAANRIITAP